MCWSCCCRPDSVMPATVILYLAISLISATWYPVPFRVKTFQVAKWVADCRSTFSAYWSNNIREGLSQDGLEALSFIRAPWTASWRQEPELSGALTLVLVFMLIMFDRVSLTASSSQNRDNGKRSSGARFPGVHGSGPSIEVHCSHAPWKIDT